MKKENGFVRITILLVLAVVVISVLIYATLFYFDLYSPKWAYHRGDTNTAGETEVANQNSEIEQLKKDVENLKNSQSQNKSGQQQKSSPQDFSISASELNPYLSGVVKLWCSKKVSGSGSLFTGGYVLTNFHVIEGSEWCTVQKTEVDATGTEMYIIKTSDSKAWNNETDVAVIKLGYIDTACIDEYGNSVKCPEIMPIGNLNYRIFNLPLCEVDMPVGSPVAIIGYPAYGGGVSDFGGIPLDQKTRIVTTGILSGYDTIGAGSPLWKTFPYPNYFISAKIDSGNSGGIAFSKSRNGLCILGVPSWLTVGNYETQGLVQSIHNIMHTSN